MIGLGSQQIDMRDIGREINPDFSSTPCYTRIKLGEEDFQLGIRFELDLENRTLLTEILTDETDNLIRMELVEDFARKISDKVGKDLQSKLFPTHDIKIDAMTRVLQM